MLTRRTQPVVKLLETSTSVQRDLKWLSGVRSAVLDGSLAAHTIFAADV
ncbi:hypothetical protein ABIB80_004517 [Bradyrhizobium sp. i1.15.2]